MIVKDDYATISSNSTLEIARTLAVSVEQAWQYLVEPDLRQLWFCAGATGSNPGDDFIMDFDHSRISDSDPPAEVSCGDPMVMTGTIVTYEHPKVFAYNWPEEGGTGTIVTIRLKSAEQGTHLRLTHERLFSPDFQRGASAGWHAHLDLLADVTSGRDTRDFWIHYGTLKQHYDQRIAKTD